MHSRQSKKQTIHNQIWAKIRGTKRPKPPNRPLRLPERFRRSIPSSPAHQRQSFSPRTRFSSAWPLSAFCLSVPSLEPPGGRRFACRPCLASRLSHLSTGRCWRTFRGGNSLLVRSVWWTATVAIDLVKGIVKNALQRQ